MKKLATNTGVMILAIIAVSGAALYFNIDQIVSPTEEVSTAGVGGLLISNVEAVQRDDAGNIIAYSQGGNHIVASGMELIARQVFGAGDVGSNNTNTTTGGKAGWGGTVKYMEIGNGSGRFGTCTDDTGAGPILGWNNETLECPLTVNGCARELAVITRFNATEDIWPLPGTNNAQINLTAVATFSGGASCDGQSIDEAGIWTNVTDRHTPGGPFITEANGNAPLDNRMFARNTFGSVNLSTSDSLELTWKFTFTDS